MTLTEPPRVAGHTSWTARIGVRRSLRRQMRVADAPWCYVTDPVEAAGGGVKEDECENPLGPSPCIGGVPSKVQHVDEDNEQGNGQVAQQGNLPAAVARIVEVAARVSDELATDIEPAPKEQQCRQP